MIIRKKKSKKLFYFILIMKNENVIIQNASPEEIEDYSIKIVIVGDSGVGKSNLLNRFVLNEFSNDCRATIGVELSSKTYKINGKVVKIHLWDTAGQERYKSITGAYYKGAKGAIIVYDITNKDSFDHVDKWIKEVKDNGGKNMNIVICGNKSDLESSRKVSTEEGIDKGTNNGLLCLETSALDCTNVEQAFQKLIIEIYNTSIKNDVKKNDDMAFLQSEGLTIESKKVGENKKKENCC